MEHSVTLAHPTGIRTWCEFGFKLSLWRFTFRNYTKSTWYEASEKNAVSETKMPQLSNLKYSCSYRNAPIYWGFSAHPSMEKSGRRIWVAEGEELGSNPLRMNQCSATDRSVSKRLLLANQQFKWCPGTPLTHAAAVPVGRAGLRRVDRQRRYRCGRRWTARRWTPLIDSSTIRQHCAG